MADLEKHGDREAWLRWAVALLRRGLWAAEIITVHGPHPPPADCMWGEAECWIDGGISGGTFSFKTRSGVRSIHDVRGLSVRDEQGERYALLKWSDLTPKAQRWLAVAELLLTKLSWKARDEQRSPMRRGEI